MNNTRSIYSLVLSLLFLGQTAGLAQAERAYDNGRCKKGDQGCERAQSRENLQRRNASRNGDSRDDWGNDSRGDRGRQGRFQGNGNERGAGPDHSFFQGQRLPANYRSRQYVVDDWQGHGLRSPPRGYHWVQTGSDYVLVAIATGLIFELLLSR